MCVCVCVCVDDISSKCRYQVSEDLQSCNNPSCPAGGQPLSITTGFDLLVDVTDHTGTLQSCYLNSSAAEKTLGCTVSQGHGQYGGHRMTVFGGLCSHADRLACLLYMSGFSLRSLPV